MRHHSLQVSTACMLNGSVQTGVSGNRTPSPSRRSKSYDIDKGLTGPRLATTNLTTLRSPCPGVSSSSWGYAYTSMLHRSRLRERLMLTNAARAAVAVKAALSDIANAFTAPLFAFSHPSSSSMPITLGASS